MLDPFDSHSNRFVDAVQHDEADQQAEEDGYNEAEHNSQNDQPNQNP